MIVRSAPRASGPSSFLLLAFASLFAGCGHSGPIDGDKAMQHVKAMVDIGPRPFGSEALAKTADYIQGELKTIGFDLKRQESVDERTKKTIRNLYVQIDGDDPVKGPILILGAHYDTKVAEGFGDAAHNFKFVGAIDGAGASSVLIELARALKQPANKPKCNVWLYWIDAEESMTWDWDHDNELVGSKAFCKWLSAEKILPRVKAFVLLDLIGSKNFKIDKDGNSDTKLQDLFERAGKAMGESDRMYHFPQANELAYYAQKGINWGTTDDHNTFSHFGVPSVLLIDFARRIPPENQGLKPGDTPQVDANYEQWWHTEKDNLAAMSSDALAFAGDLVMQAMPELEAFCLNRK